HKEDPSVARAKKGAAGSPWDKAGAAKKGKQSADPLGLDKPENVCDMYTTQNMYGAVPLPEPKDVCAMYESKKFY
ncbi:hypothetical protein IWW54_003345, partial [Coemansia sp. RSA 2705]